MSDWRALIDLQMSVQTGDGKVYTPDWLCATFSAKSKEYNIADYEFLNVSGTLRLRGLPKGNVYDFEAYFQGTDTLDQAAQFAKSADNAGRWIINHPFYGALTVQPKNLKQDNAGWNVTKFTAEVIETINANGTTPVNNGPDAVAAQSTAAAKTLTKGFAAKVSTISPSGIATLQANIKSVFNTIIRKMNGLQSDVDTVNNYCTQALGVLNTATYDTDQIITAAVQLITAPAFFADTVANRITMLRATLDVLLTDVAPVLALYNVLTAALKQQIETNAGAAIAGICAACVTGVTNDYQYRPVVLDVITDVIDSYNSYINAVVAMQSLVGGELDSYIPDYDNMAAVKNLVANTINALFAIYATAKQQRTYTLPQDSNMILVANYLYGMLPDDSTILTLIANNNLQYADTLKLKKGREIIYYV